MKLFYIGGGLFILLFICIIPLGRNIEEYNVQKNGECINAIITYIPVCIGTKISYFMKFTYGGQTFAKKVGCAFADTHKIGETIRLRHIKNKDIFLFDHENKETDFIATALLAVFGIVCIAIGARLK